MSTARATLLAWWLACRPKTLSAAVVPVMVGSAVAFKLEGFQAGPALAALVGALLIQIGSNLANDVFDYEQGADTGARLGPLRVVQAGLLSPRAVRLGMLVVFGGALMVGTYLATIAGLPIVVIGLCSIAAAVLYTAGPFPLGYHGLGDVFVMVFFGLVAVCGTVYVQLLSVPELAVWCSLPVGSLATAILVVNNVRDRETDVLANKRTLAVRFGHKAGLWEYALLMSIAYLTPVLLLVTGQVSLWLLLPLASLPIAVRLVRRICCEAGAALNGVLVGTAKLLLGYGVLFSLSLWLDARMTP